MQILRLIGIGWHGRCNYRDMSSTTHPDGDTYLTPRTRSGDRLSAATARIRINRPDDDVYDLLMGTDAILTTDHPASSCGLPVVIVDGRLLGPSEVAAIVSADPSVAWRDMESDYVDGADSVSLGEPWDRASADAVRAVTLRYDAGTLTLLDAARRAGYNVRVAPGTAAHCAETAGY